MSLWVVARELRLRGVQNHLAAAYAWQDASTGEARSGSCGIFLIGPATSTRPLWGPDVFSDPSALPSFTNGQGYPLTPYLPHGDASGPVMRDTVSTSTPARLTGDWEALPPARQTRAHLKKFDPHGLLFRKGVHMPLVVFVGGTGRRSPEALDRRDQRAQARRDGRGRAAHRGQAQSQGDAR